MAELLFCFFVLGEYDAKSLKFDDFVRNLKFVVLYVVLKLTEWKGII